MDEDSASSKILELIMGCWAPNFILFTSVMGLWPVMIPNDGPTVFFLQKLEWLFLYIIVLFTSVIWLWPVMIPNVGPTVLFLQKLEWMLFVFLYWFSGYVLVFMITSVMLPGLVRITP